MVNNLDMQDDCVRANDFIILRHGDHHVLHQVTKKSHVKVFTSDIDVSNVIGNPFWSMYRLTRVAEKKNAFIVQLVNPDTAQSNLNLSVQSSVDNRLLEDDNSSQLLSKDEIISMRENGQSSEQIVKELIKNSTSFSHKTEFAQQKYLKKKSKKYIDYVQVLRPSLRLVANVILKGSENLGLKPDTLSQIITSVSFQPSGKYITYESGCNGIVLAYLLNSLSAEGKLLNVITNGYVFNKRKALKALQFGEEKWKRLINVNSDFFLKYSKYNEEVEENEVAEEEPEEDGGSKKRKNTASDDAPQKRAPHLEAQENEVKNLLLEKADGLVFVSKEIMNSMLVTMLQYLAPSRPFVVYSPCREPLMKLFVELKSRKDVTFVRLFENQLRMYQVLENRTHPENMMCPYNGYLLTGITVDNT